MKAFLYSSLLLLGLAALPLQARAQDNYPPTSFNLLPDPGFNQQTPGVTLSTGIHNVYGINNGYEADDIASWQSANDASPDYFATNQTSSSGTHPDSAIPEPYAWLTQLGVFNPDMVEHNGAIGLQAGDAGHKEYITPRGNALTFAKGGTYYASFWTYGINNPQFASSTGPFGAGNVGTSKISLALSRQDFRGTYGDINGGQANPGVFSTFTSNVLPARQWTHSGGLIHGVQASTSYWPIVGNFESLVRPAAYYYIDNVTLYRVPTAGPPTLATTCGAAVAIGEGNPIPGATYTWTSTANDLTAGQRNQIRITVSPRVTTTYRLTVAVPGEHTGGIITNWETHYTEVTITPASNIVPTAFTGPLLPAALCIGSGSQDIALSVENKPGATSYTWTLAPAGQASIVSGQGTSQAVVRFAAGKYTTTVSVVANYACGSSAPVSASTAVSDGPPAMPELVQEDPSLYIGRNQAKVFITNFDANARYTVYNVQYANPTIAPGFSQVEFIVKGGGGGFSTDYKGYLYVVATNSCGSTASATFEVDYLMPTPRAAPADNATAYPNPANETLTLPTDAQRATLLNMQGQPVLRAQTAGQLKVDRLPAGLYNLQFYRNGKLVNQRIEVKH